MKSLRVLSLALIAVSGLGTTVHLVVREPWVRSLVDAMFGLTLLAVLAGWIHLNRIALTRFDPDAGAIRPQIRIVRSRDERIIFPYDVL